MKSYQKIKKQITNFGKVAVLGTAALFYACAPKGGANSTAPIINIPNNNNNNQVVEEFGIKTPLNIIYNLARKQIAKPENYSLNNILYQKVTNQTPFLETKGGGLENLILTEEETKKKVANLKEVNPNKLNSNKKYVPQILDSLTNFKPGKYHLEIEKDGIVYNSLFLEIIEKDERTEREEKGLRVGTLPPVPPLTKFPSLIWNN